jgi:hypothetical protein
MDITHLPRFKWSEPVPVLQITPVGSFMKFVSNKDSEIPAIRYTSLNGASITRPLNSWEYEQFRYDDTHYLETLFDVHYQFNNQHQVRIEVAPAFNTIH